MHNISDPLFIFASLLLFLPSKTGLRVEVAVGVSIGVKYSYIHINLLMVRSPESTNTDVRSSFFIPVSSSVMEGLFSKRLEVWLHTNIVTDFIKK